MAVAESHQTNVSTQKAEVIPFPREEAAIKETKDLKKEGVRLLKLTGALRNQLGATTGPSAPVTKESESYGEAMEKFVLAIQNLETAILHQLGKKNEQNAKVGNASIQGAIANLNYATKQLDKLNAEIEKSKQVSSPLSLIGRILGAIVAVAIAVVTAPETGGGTMIAVAVLLAGLTASGAMDIIVNKIAEGLSHIPGLNDEAAKGVSKCLMFLITVAALVLSSGGSAGSAAEEVGTVAKDAAEDVAEEGAEEGAKQGLSATQKYIALQSLGYAASYNPTSDFILSTISKNDSEAEKKRKTILATVLGVVTSIVLVLGSIKGASSICQSYESLGNSESMLGRFARKLSSNMRILYAVDAVGNGASAAASGYTAYSLFQQAGYQKLIAEHKPLVAVCEVLNRLANAAMQADAKETTATFRNFEQIMQSLRFGSAEAGDSIVGLR